MSRYAVKVGEIQLRSDKPITEEQRKAAMEQMKAYGYCDALPLDDGLKVVGILQSG